VKSIFVRSSLVPSHWRMSCSVVFHWESRIH